MSDCASHFFIYTLRIQQKFLKSHLELDLLILEEDSTILVRIHQFKGFVI